MKRLVYILSVFGLAFATQAASWRTFSFINPLVTSIQLTNTVGATNLNHGYALGGVWTNGPGAAQANGTQMTNWAGSGVNMIYTNNAPLSVSGTNLPGVLVIDVTTNLSTTGGSFGIPPFSASNLTYAKTNDALNLFQDVMFPTDWNPSLGPGGGPGATNIVYGGVIEVGLLGSQLAGSGDGSNYVTFVFVPLDSNKNEMTLTLAGGVAAGAFMSMWPYSFSITNAGSTKMVGSSIIPIPAYYLYGASGIRLLSATPGVAWSTGGSVWLTSCNLRLLCQ